MESGKVYLGTLTLANGRIAKPTGMASISGRMETATKENGKIV